MRDNTAPEQRSTSQDPVGFASKQQSRAANPAASAWVDASAGSGKTKVLIDRVLRLLLAGVPAQRILCLTFTKAAAANMAVRLTGELGKWATLQNSALQEKIHKLTGVVPEAETVAHARRLFAATLDAPGGLQFQTIHSFCQSLLARFPLEANVPVGFNVLEDRQSQALLMEARRGLLNRATQQPESELAQALTCLLETFAGDDFAKLENEIVAQRGILEAQLAGKQGFALAALPSVLGLAEDEDEASVVRAFCSDERHDIALLTATAQALITDGGKTNSERGTVLANWLAKDVHGRTMLLDEFTSVFLTNEGDIRAAICTKKFGEANPDMADLLHSEAEQLLRLLETRRAARTARTSRAVIIYAAELLGSYHHLKAERLALDYDDLIMAAARLVTAERASWVLYKLDGGIDHVLVDEAQDTNERQWQLIEALTSEFFSGEGAREYNPARSMFAVGDYKQSIYSFQGADPNAFMAARQRLILRLEAIESKLENVGFNVSFRSTSAVLTAVDRVFKETGASNGLGESYTEHQSAQPELPGQVEIWPIAPPDAEDASIRLHPRSKAALQIAAQIRHWVNSKEPLPSRGRSMEYGDFLVLVRSRGSFMPEFVRACKQLGVPVSGADRMIIDEQLAVEDLLAFASFLLLPEDDLTLATVLKGPLIGLSEDALFKLAHGRGKGVSLLSRLGRDMEGRKYAEWLAGWQRRTDRVTPYTLLSALLAEPCPTDERSGRRAIITRLGPEANDPMDELLALALQYEQAETPSLQGFLRWIKSGKTEIKRELEQALGQVRIMTVHGSKGLEAPVVIVADSLEGPKDKTKLLVDPQGISPPLLAGSNKDEAAAARERRTRKRQREREEYHRLLYVALTRAEDRLIFASWARRNTKLDDEGRLLTSPEVPAWYHLMLQGLQAGSEEIFDFTAQGGWRGAGLLYRSGNPNVKRADKHATGKIRVTDAVLPDWATREPPQEPTPTRPLTPSKLEDEETVLSPLEAGDDGTRFRRGLLLHRLLQLLPDLPADKRASACLAWLGKQSTQPQRLLDEVMAVIAHPEYGVLFGPNSRAEVPISGRVGNRVLSGQIDRLAVTKDTVWLVDYKTNRQPAATPESVDKAYLKQMAAYRAALQPLYPQHRIRSILLWTNGPSLMELPDNLLESYKP